MDRVPEPGWTTEPFAIMNIGNMRFLWDHGEAYDVDQDGDHITAIKDRFAFADFDEELDDQMDKAFLFWQYMKYMVRILGTHQD